MIPEYRQRGWATVRVHPMSKRPIGDAWQQHTDEPHEFKPGENVGVMLGDSSGGLVDIDLDCAEAVALAPAFLPATATFGRASKLRSHWIYQCPGVKTRKPPRTHTELRANGKNGRVVQTVFPPSIHESGEEVAWTDDTAVAAIDEANLLASFGALTAASVLARAWPDLEGSKHDAVLAIAGALWHEGWSLEQALALMLPAMELDGSSEPHREAAIRDTWDDTGRTRFGWPTVAQILGPLDVKSFQRAVELVPVDKPRIPPEGIAMVDGEGTEHQVRPMTDAGNAERFADQFRDELRFVPGLGWHRWDGTRWERTGTPPTALAIKSARTIQAQAQALGNSDMAKWGLSSENASRLRSTITLAQELPEMCARPDQLDRDQWVLNCPNGTVDLRTGAIIPHAANALITKMAGVPYEPTAKAPRFLQFLSEVFCSDWDLAMFVVRYLGYGLTGCVSEQVFQLWVGDGSNGKGVLIKALLHVLGDYGQSLAGDLLIQRRNSRASEAASPDVARLRGSRFAAGNEVPEGQRWNEPLLKQLTGEDRIVARELYQQPIEFEPTWKLVLAVNHKPIVRGADHGVWRRIHTVPFDAKFDAAAQDRGLAAKLRAEGEGILALLVAGCLQWQATGLQPPTRVLAENAEYRKSQDVIGLFLEECTAAGPGKTASKAKLYQVYRKWCADGGEWLMGKHIFNNRLRERGWAEKRTSGDRVWDGMALRTDATYGAVG